MGGGDGLEHLGLCLCLHLCRVVCLCYFVSLSWVGLAGCAHVLCVPLKDACLGWGFCHSALSWHVLSRGCICGMADRLGLCVCLFIL